MPRVLVLLSLVGLVGCTSWAPTKNASSIDARYRLQKLESETNAGAESPGVRAYQKWLSQTLASHCRYLPSDSRYERLFAKRCGPFKATVKSMARFMEEYDAPSLNRSVISMGDEIYYEDIPSDCDWL